MRVTISGLGSEFIARMAILASLIVLVAVSVPAQIEAIPKLQKTIDLPGVQGRIDHMAFDAKTGRLFVAALGNNTVEIVDVNQGKRLHSISGLHEPQGILYLRDVNRLYVANAADGIVLVFDGTTYGLIKSISLGSDADNVRFDSEHREIYVGYGSGALGILREDGSVVGDIKLDAHPESFQLETVSHRIFVNLPGSKKVAVVDRNTKAVAATWSTGAALANFPMALDEQGHRLFIVCRQPATLLVLNTDTGAVIAKLPTVGDCDDVFYDRASKRVYASGGGGSVSVFEEKGPAQFRELGRISTRKGARTSFFSSESQCLYVAARQQGSEAAAIYVFTTKP